MYLWLRLSQPRLTVVKPKNIAHATADDLFMFSRFSLVKWPVISELLKWGKKPVIDSMNNEKFSEFIEMYFVSHRKYMWRERKRNFDLQFIKRSFMFSSLSRILWSIKEEGQKVNRIYKTNVPVPRHLQLYGIKYM